MANDQTAEFGVLRKGRKKIMPTPLSHLVSVIVPCYNKAEYLPAALESLIEQTYRNLEILIVDDGSNDASVAVAKAFTERDSRIRLFEKSNGGPASTRNLGIDYAKGKYVAFLDGDDFWHPHKVELHMRHFAAIPNLGVSYSGTRFVGMNGKPLIHARVPKTSGLSPYYLYCRYPITNGSNAVFLRELFDFHRFDENLLYSEDVDWWLRVVFAPPARWTFGGISEKLTYYRVHASSMSHDFSKHYECAKRVWEKSKEYAPEIASQFASLAEAFLLRFYARRAISAKDNVAARRYIREAFTKDSRIIFREPLQTAVTLLAAMIPLSLLKASAKSVSRKVVG